MTRCPRHTAPVILVGTLSFNLISLPCAQSERYIRQFKTSTQTLHPILISMGKGRKGVQSIIGGGRSTGGILKNSIVGPKGMKTRQEEMVERISRASEGKYYLIPRQLFVTLVQTRPWYGFSSNSCRHCRRTLPSRAILCVLRRFSHGQCYRD